jgi:hypothetical protein
MIPATRNALLLLALTAWFAACGPPPTPAPVNSNGAAPTAAPQGIPPPVSSVPGDLTFKTPDGWTSEQPSSPMRVAQYKLPGDAGPASLAVFYFGQGQGGTVDDNFSRWNGQMNPITVQPKTEKLTVNGLEATLLDVSGTFSGDTMGSTSTAIPNARMRAAIIETPKGRYFIKLTGPENTVTRWNDSFMAFVKSAEFKK